MKKTVRKPLPRKLSNYKALEKKSIPTGVVTQDRTPWFAPYLHLQPSMLGTRKKPIVLETAFGKVIFKNGRLDQIHRDIIQILFTFPREFVMYEELDFRGRLRRYFTFSAGQMYRYLGVANPTKEWLKKKLDEMKDTSISCVPDKNKDLKGHFQYENAYFSILNDVVELNESNQYIHPDTWVEGHFEVEFSPLYLECYNFDTAIHSQRLTADILALNEGYNKALVYHCITHTNLNKSLEELMRDIGLPTRENNADLFNRYKKMITSPENIERMFDKFKIRIYQPNPKFDKKRWAVTYYSADLEGKVWFDNHEKRLHEVKVKKNTGVTKAKPVKNEIGVPNNIRYIEDVYGD